MITADLQGLLNIERKESKNKGLELNSNYKTEVMDISSEKDKPRM